MIQGIKTKLKVLTNSSRQHPQVSTPRLQKVQLAELITEKDMRSAVQAVAKKLDWHIDLNKQLVRHALRTWLHKHLVEFERREVEHVMGDTIVSFAEEVISYLAEYDDFVGREFQLLKRMTEHYKNFLGRNQGIQMDVSSAALDLFRARRIREESQSDE